MAMTCKFCRSPQRAALERELANGASYRDIAAKLDIDIASISRHVNNCVPNKIAKAAEKRDMNDGLNAITVLAEREKVVEDQLRRALAIEDVAVSIKWTLKAIETGLKVTELNARLTGQLSGAMTQITLLSDPTFVWLRDTIMTTLDVESQLKLTAALQEIAEREESEQ